MKKSVRRTSKRQSVITSIGVSRLYNLGNYQNVKYDLVAEVPRGSSAHKTLLLLSRIVNALKPLKRPEFAEEYEKAVMKKESERTEWEKEQMDYWTKSMAEFHAKTDNRNGALMALDNLGGTETTKNASDSWTFPDDEF